MLSSSQNVPTNHVLLLLLLLLLLRVAVGIVVADRSRDGQVKQLTIGPLQSTHTHKHLHVLRVPPSGCMHLQQLLFYSGVMDPC